MRIKEIEIDNFKSFRSKTSIPFLDGFTTISGPNGSGKSNIIDCVLFCLGLSTSRTLRAEKLTDLINNQTSKREASVKIIFSDGNNPETTFDIKRKIKDGPSGYTSTYYLNGRVSTLTEVHKALSDYNVSPGCYNVMMQGDVTGIINMGPTERRRIIDELAGVTEFDRRIDQATREMETVQDRIERSNIILSEIDTNLDQLSEEREQALKYQSLKDKKQDLEDQITLAKYADIKKSLYITQQNISEATKEKKQINENISGIVTQKDQAQKHLDDLNELVKTKGEDEQINLTKQVEILKGEIFRKEQDIEYSHKRISENVSTVERSQAEIKKLLDNIDDTNLRIDNKCDQQKLIEQQIEKENAELIKLLEESGDLTKAVQHFVDRRNELRKQLEKTEDEHGRLIRENLKLEDNCNRLKNEISELEKVLNSSDEEKAYLNERKEDLERKLNNFNEEREACEIVSKRVMAEMQDIKAQISELEAKQQQEYRRLMQLEATKKAAEDVHLGRAAETILNADIPGVHKTLAQLGRVEKEFSLALETAMGGRMKSIVTDDEHVAADAIDYLKQARAGRATFLPLNKIRYYVPSCNLPNVDGVIDFAINLIDFDGIYKNAFYYALGETLVVENIEIAKPLMGEFRMVTLDGALIEKSGAMTGGSQNKNNLKFANSFDNEIKVLTERIKQITMEKDLLEDEYDKLDRKLDRNREDYSRYLNEIHKKKLELENIEKTLGSIDQSLESKAHRLAESRPKLTEAELEKRSIEEELEEFSTKIDTIRAEIEEVDSSIPADKLEQIEELTGNIEFEIKNLEAKLRNIEADIKKITMEKEFKEQSISIQKEKIEKCKQENIELEKEKANSNSEISGIKVKVDNLYKQLDALSDELKEAQKERDEAAKELRKFETLVDKAQNDIQRFEETIAAYSTRKKELSKEINVIKEDLLSKNVDLTRAQEIQMSAEEINKTIERLSKKMDALGLVNMRAIQAYDDVLKRKDELSNRINTLSSEKEELNTRLNGYENMKKQCFMTTFENVDKNFKEIFATLSDGEGSLVLENPEEPFKGGLTIEARPRGKKLLRLDAMSGGEKSLTALAFVFAFQKYLPAPFYAFDEVDMFLDGANVEKLAEMIRTQASNAQFIVVSLRKPMLKRADRTIGVTQRKDGITKVTGVKLNG